MSHFWEHWTVLGQLNFNWEFIAFKNRTLTHLTKPQRSTSTNCFTNNSNNKFHSVPNEWMNDKISYNGMCFLFCLFNVHGNDNNHQTMLMLIYLYVKYWFNGFFFFVFCLFNWQTGKDASTCSSVFCYCCASYVALQCLWHGQRFMRTRLKFRPNLSVKWIHAKNNDTDKSLKLSQIFVRWIVCIEKNSCK